MSRNRHGFTLIELLIVVVIIGILASIAIPKFANTKERAIVANMKSALRNLVTAQEAYLADNFAYYNGAIPSPNLTYNPTSGITVTIVNVQANGWAATATGLNTTRTCAIFVGGVPPVAPATAEGQVACTP